MRDPRHDILFEPVRIGPKTAPNRFYQVPHCTGMGWHRPRMLAAMRGVKAEGGWGVVNTEYCSVHPTSDNDYYPFAALWDEDDIAAHRLMVEAVQAHGALAGVELWIGGSLIGNYATRLPPMGLRSMPVGGAGAVWPGQSRAMDLADIRAIRQWHRDAARRALEAGFDIVYVYATHGYLLSEFLNPATNTRGDAYGGSLENRVRLVRELLEDTREVLAGRAALACRFSIDLADPETYDAFGLLADLPDLWDLTVPDYGTEMGTSRFVKEGALVPSVARARQMTDRPVVAVGRFTSPDTMAQVIRSGAQDLIGAARPSIADPFLPAKIRDGRSDEIRECIGCNICYAHNAMGVPIRCTQNPTMGEEWRLGWHPERVPPAPRRRKVLVVGGGPAGMEAARVLGERGHEVLLAEAGRTLGGRVSRESRLPGLSEWARVRDWRAGRIERLEQVSVYLESRMTAEDIHALEVDHVLLATGADWATDGVGRHAPGGYDTADPSMILGVDDLLAGAMPEDGHVVIHDDDHGYMGSVLALMLRGRGHPVTLVTPAGDACAWGRFTDEQHASNAALIAAGVVIVTRQTVTGFADGTARLACVFTGQTRTIDCALVVPLTRRVPRNELLAQLTEGARAHPSVRCIGDAEAPSLIAMAVHSGYRAAMELDGGADPGFARRDHPMGARPETLSRP